MSIEELKLDISELTILITQSTRSRIKNKLLQIRGELEKEILNLEMKTNASQRRAAEDCSNKRYIVEMREFAWDQSDSFIKIFMSLKDVQSCEEGAVSLKLTEDSMNLRVSNLNGKDYCLTINNLLLPINVERCHRKIKEDMISIYLRKLDEGKHWENLTKIEQRLKQKQDTDLQKNNENPEAALVNIMKKMYNDGDSKTKQMIAKAWTESQEKARNIGGVPGQSDI